jgi:hypothetical protein
MSRTANSSTGLIIGGFPVKKSKKPAKELIQVAVNFCVNVYSRRT